MYEENDIKRELECAPDFHGVPNLKQDGRGHVYWRGRNIEHYSFTDKAEEAREAQKLGEWCQELERKGFPVTGRTATEAPDKPMFGAAPADTPWLAAMLNIYTVIVDNENRAMALILDTDRHGAMLQVKDGQPQVEYVPDEPRKYGVVSLLHGMQDMGYQSRTIANRDYSEFVRAMDEAGITPDMIPVVFANVPAPVEEDAESPQP